MTMTLRGLRDKSQDATREYSWIAEVPGYGTYAVLANNIGAARERMADALHLTYVPDGTWIYLRP